MSATDLLTQLTAATQAVTDNAAAFGGAAVAVAQREAAAVIAAGFAAGADVSELAQALSMGPQLGAFGGTVNALTAKIAGAIVWPQIRPGMRFTGVAQGANSDKVTLLLAGFAASPGVLPLRTRLGAELAAGDLQAGAFKFEVGPTATDYRLTNFTTSEIAAIVSAILGGGTISSGVQTGILAARVPTNINRLSTNVRSNLSGSGTFNWYTAMSGLVDSNGKLYNKKGAAGATKLLCLAEVSGYVPTAGGAGPTVQRLTDGTNVDIKYLAVDINLSGVGAVSIINTPIFMLTNVPAGDVNLSLQWSRLDGTAWNGIANPDGPDFGGSGSHTGTGTTSTFTCMEIPA